MILLFIQESSDQIIEKDKLFFLLFILEPY